MNELYKGLDEKDGLIAALKAVNDEWQETIDMLVTKGVKKDELIHALKRRLEWMETQLREYQE